MTTNFPGEEDLTLKEKQAVDYIWTSLTVDSPGEQPHNQARDRVWEFLGDMSDGEAVIEKIDKAVKARLEFLAQGPVVNRYLFRGVVNEEGDTIVMVQDEYNPGTPPKRLENSKQGKRKSPSGFSWGYGGSGPHALAHAILFHIYGSETFATIFMSDLVGFMNRNIVGRSPNTDGRDATVNAWTMTDSQVRTMILRLFTEEPRDGRLGHYFFL